MVKCGHFNLSRLPWNGFAPFDNTFASSQLEWDVLAQIPGMKEWNDAMSQSDIAKRIETDRLANMPEFMQHVKAQIQASNTK